MVTAPAFVSGHRSAVIDIPVPVFSMLISAGTILVVTVFMVVVSNFGNV